MARQHSMPALPTVDPRSSDTLSARYNWCYTPEDGKDIVPRIVPDYRGQRGENRIKPGTVFGVSQEVQGAEGVLYLKLADGTGWLFDSKPGVGVLCTRRAKGNPMQTQRDTVNEPLVPLSSRPENSQVTSEVAALKSTIAQLKSDQLSFQQQFEEVREALLQAMNERQDLWSSLQDMKADVAEQKASIENINSPLREEVNNRLEEFRLDAEVQRSNQAWLKKEMEGFGEQIHEALKKSSGFQEEVTRAVQEINEMSRLHLTQSMEETKATGDLLKQELRDRLEKMELDYSMQQAQIEELRRGSHVSSSNIQRFRSEFIGVPQAKDIRCGSVSLPMGDVSSLQQVQASSATMVKPTAGFRHSGSEPTHKTTLSLPNNAAIKVEGSSREIGTAPTGQASARRCASSISIPMQTSTVLTSPMQTQLADAKQIQSLCSLHGSLKTQTALISPGSSLINKQIAPMPSSRGVTAQTISDTH